MFKGVTTQTNVVKHRGRFAAVSLPPKKGEKMEELKEGYTSYSEKEPFVKKDVMQPAGTKAEGVNLLNMIEIRMKNLLQSLNAIESLTSALDKNLLPPETQGEKEANVEAKKPQGWLENHIENLELLISRAGQIHYQVNRLTQATKTNKIGQ